MCRNDFQAFDDVKLKIKLVIGYRCEIDLKQIWNLNCFEKHHQLVGWSTEWVSIMFTFVILHINTWKVTGVAIYKIRERNLKCNAKYNILSQQVFQYCVHKFGFHGASDTLKDRCFLQIFYEKFIMNITKQRLFCN